MLILLISVDSGDPHQIQEIKDWGFTIDKVTSNPTTVSATIKRIKQEKNKSFSVYDVEMLIRDTVGERTPISVETIGTPYPSYDPENMDPYIFAEEAQQIMDWDPYFVVKLPTVPQGFEAANILRGRVPINFTLVFSRHQARLAADYGGTYVSPFVGRIDDKLKDTAIKREGMDLVKEIIEDYKKEDFDTLVLTASTRKEKNLYHLQKAADYGSHVVTIPFSLFEHIYQKYGDGGVEIIKRLREYKSHSPQNPKKPTYSDKFNWESMQQFERELTLDGVERFLADAQSSGYTIMQQK